MLFIPLAKVLLAEPGSTVDFGLFAQFGVVGVIAAMGIVFAKGAYARERDRADRMEAENKRLNELILDRVIPTLMSASRVGEETTELLRAIQRERDSQQPQQQQQPPRRQVGNSE